MCYCAMDFLFVLHRKFSVKKNNYGEILNIGEDEGQSFYLQVHNDDSNKKELSDTNKNKIKISM